MSKYRYKFYGEGQTIHSGESEIVDLVDDYQDDPEELDGMSEEELEARIHEYWEQWFWNNFNGGFHKIEDDE